MAVDRCKLTLKTDYGRREYKTGFHCFVDRKDAKAFAKQHFEVVVRVEFDPNSVTAFGYQNGFTAKSMEVVVARRIRLIEITDDYSRFQPKEKGDLR